MQFKILGFKRKGVNYEYLVRGEDCWGITDILPQMLEVSKHSKYYFLTANFNIMDRRVPSRIAQISIESTLSPQIRKIYVFDSGIGKQMIDKYIRSIEN